MIKFEKELNHILNVYFQGLLFGSTMINKLGKDKYDEYMWQIVENGADCIHELRTNDIEREQRVMEGIKYLFTQGCESDIENEIKDHLLLEKHIFLELVKKDQERFMG